MRSIPFFLHPYLSVYEATGTMTLGIVGGNLYTQENDTGPDDANHAQYGLMIFSDPQQPGNGHQIEGAQIYDILPTLLHTSVVPVPDGLRGKVLDLCAGYLAHPFRF